MCNKTIHMQYSTFLVGIMWLCLKGVSTFTHTALLYLEFKSEFKLTSLWSAYLHNSIQANIFGNYFISQEEQKELDEITAKRQKKGKNEDESPAEEKTILHGIANPSNLVLTDTECLF